MTSNEQPSEGSPGSNIYHDFWSARGQECLDIISLMSSREDWALDGELGHRLDIFAAELIRNNEDCLDITSDEFLEIQAWLTSEKGIMIASILDERRPERIVEILSSGGTRPQGEAFKLFVERVVTFSRARLIHDIFKAERVRRVVRLARGLSR